MHRCGANLSEPRFHHLPRVTAALVPAELVTTSSGRHVRLLRALGGRSSIGDAQSSKMQEVMNLKIKFRESFRPIAPTVLRDQAREWFESKEVSPCMLLLAIRSTIPAVTHMDYSARVQTVTEDHNPMYYRMIQKFGEKYGCPVIINTSFNVLGEPIVGTPEHTYLCFMRMNMDYLLVGNFLLEKKDQKRLDKDINWLKEFELD